MSTETYPNDVTIDVDSPRQVPTLDKFPGREYVVGDEAPDDPKIGLVPNEGPYKT